MCLAINPQMSHNLNDYTHSMHWGFPPVQQRKKRCETALKCNWKNLKWSRYCWQVSVLLCIWIERKCATVSVTCRVTNEEFAEFRNTFDLAVAVATASAAAAAATISKPTLNQVTKKSAAAQHLFKHIIALIDWESHVMRYTFIPVAIFLSVRHKLIGKWKLYPK